MFHLSPLRAAALAACLLGIAAYAIFGGFFAREIVVEIATLAILAVAIDLAAGFGGMVSLCHGAIMGLSAYGYTVATVKFGLPTFPAALAGIALSVVFGLVVGAVTANTTGIFFIMATLAFGQMAYSVVFKSRWLGGDDGMAGVPRFDLSAIGLEMNDSLQFALFAVLLVALAFALAAIPLRAAFGRTLCGIRSNEARMRALGVAVRVRKTQAFGVSSLIAGVAGIVAAQHTQFISPELLFWTVSGEALIVVILGGLGTLVGPVLGAIVFVLLKHEVSDYTNHWHIVVGLVLIGAVLIGGRGLFGELEHRLRAREVAGDA